MVYSPRPFLCRGGFHERGLSGMADTFYDISVAGVTFEGRQELLAELHKAQEAGAGIATFLVREPDNKYDANAIQVLAEGNDGPKHVGYVPRHLAAKLAPLLDAGATVTTDPARIICGGLDSTVFGVRFTIMVKEAG